MSYKAPVGDIAFWLRRVAGLDADMAAGLHPDLSGDLVDAVIGEAARFAEARLAPLDRIGDTVGARLENGRVRMPEGFPEAYRDWAEAGWNGLAGPTDHGGQGLPIALWAATLEIWNAANIGFATGVMLTHGAAVALEAHGSPAEKALWLRPLVDGRYMGTMNLTEPQAGSDLGALRTRAEPAGDGTYRIFGQKIFITYGDHDLTESIVHLVLARLPDAPAGTRGISLFVVPKHLPDADGRPGALNDVTVAGLEHKLGLHASPTCVLSFGDRGGATGWLVGAPHKGLAAMFTMMNTARLGVGVQGVGLAERATQRAVAYALDRRQGRSAGWAGEGMSPIAHHPDVKRMLLTMRGLTDAARALAFALAVAIDRSEVGAEPERAAARERVALLIPVVKAFATDTAVTVASLGVQVHGGMGYIEETGAAQHLRDARILPIYEGTNGIQAIDLVTRKLPLRDGAVLEAFVADLRALVADARALRDAEAAALADRADTALDDLVAAAAWLRRALAEGRPSDALAGATPFLRLTALAAGGALHLRALTLDARDGAATPAATRRRLVARFYVTDILPETAALRAAATAGAAVVDALDPALLSA